MCSHVETCSRGLDGDLSKNEEELEEEGGE
jgi:hypothetical protein